MKVTSYHCVMNIIYSEGYESITEYRSIIEPDIDNSTESDNNAGCSRGINLIHNKLIF